MTTCVRSLNLCTPPPSCGDDFRLLSQDRKIRRFQKTEYLGRTFGEDRLRCTRATLLLGEDPLRIAQLRGDAARDAATTGCGPTQSQPAPERHKRGSKRIQGSLRRFPGRDHVVSRLSGYLPPARGHPAWSCSGRHPNQ